MAKWVSTWADARGKLHVSTVYLASLPAYFRKYKHRIWIWIGAVDNKMGYITQPQRAAALSFLPHTHIMHTMQTITTPTAITTGAGRQPLTSILIHTSLPVDAADSSIAAPRVRFVTDLQVVRSPVLAEDEMMLTCHMAGRAQTPIRRRVKVAYKEVRIRPPVLKRMWTATFGHFEREEQIDYGNEPSVFVCQTPGRPTALRSPPPLRRKRRKVEDDSEDVSEELKAEYAAWIKARIVAAKLASV